MSKNKHDILLIIIGIVIGIVIALGVYFIFNKTNSAKPAKQIETEESKQEIAGVKDYELYNLSDYIQELRQSIQNGTKEETKEYKIYLGDKEINIKAKYFVEVRTTDDNTDINEPRLEIKLEINNKSFDGLFYKGFQKLDEEHLILYSGDQYEGSIEQLQIINKDLETIKTIDYKPYKDVIISRLDDGTPYKIGFYDDVCKNNDEYDYVAFYELEYDSLKGEFGELTTTKTDIDGAGQLGCSNE